jgi:hypothetical protein
MYNELLHLHCSFSNHMFEPVEIQPTHLNIIYGIKRLEIVHCILYTEFALQCLAVLNPFCHILPGCEVIGPSLS